MAISEDVLDHLFMLVLPGGAISGPQANLEQIFPCPIARMAEDMGLVQVFREPQSADDISARLTISLTDSGRELVGLNS